MYGSWKYKHDKLHVKDNHILRLIFPMELSYRVLQRYAPTGYMGYWLNYRSSRGIPGSSEYRNCEGHPNYPL